MEVKTTTKIRREKNENCVEFSFHSISGYNKTKMVKLMSKVGNYGLIILTVWDYTY